MLTLAGTSQPYFWTERNAWYINVKVDGKRQKQRLGATKKEAFDKWKAGIKNASYSRTDPSFLLIATKWLEVQIGRFDRGEISANWLARVNRTVQAFTSKHALRCSEITPEFADGFVQGKSSNYARTELATIKQVLSWAAKSKRIVSSPLDGYSLPPTQTRDRVMSVKEHNQLCRNTSRKFKRLLRMAWLTGCRPGELRGLLWSQITEDFSRAVLKEHKTSRKTGKPRIIYFPPRAQALLRAWKRNVASDYVFSNHRRKPWTKNAIVCRMRELRKATGLDLVSYNYRHGWIHRALLSGLDIATVAELAGHADIQMVAKVYSHLGQAKQFLVDAVAKVQ